MSDLQLAARDGGLKTVEAGASINVPASKYNGRTALQAASEGAHLAIVKKVLGMEAIANAGPAHYGVAGCRKWAC